MSDAEKINRALTKTVERVVTKISLDVVANLKAAASEGGTPIDTAWASSNWVPSIGNDRSGTVGTRENVSHAEQGSGELALLTYKLPQGTVFISNFVPYIGLLNTTRPSSQAAPGFVERAIDKALNVDLRGLG